MVELPGNCTFGEKVGFAGTCMMRVCTRVREMGGRQYELRMCNWYAVIFFPTLHLIKGYNHKASCCSTHIGSLPPLLPNRPHRTLPSVEETPAGECEVLQRGGSTAVASPFSAVSQHRVPSCLKLPLCHCENATLPGQKNPHQLCGMVRDSKQVTYGCE